MDNIERLKQRITELEFANDQLASELVYLDGLMRAIGFTDGLATVKATARELYEQGQEEVPEEDVA